MNHPSLFQLIFLQGGFNTNIVMLGAGFLGIAASLVGSFVLLRKRSLIGDALAHGTLPGIALAFLISIYFGSGEKNNLFLLCGATFTGVLAIFAVQAIVYYSRLTEDAAIGIVLSTFFGAGVTLISVLQQLDRGNVAGLNHFIYGQAAAMQKSDVYVMTGLALLTIFVAIFLFKEFRTICFDEDFAATQGWPVARLDIVMMTLVVIIVVAGLQAVGIILVIALLIIPAASARLWSERMGRVTALSALFGGVSGHFGAAFSAAYPDMPAGAIIVLTSSTIFLFSLLLSPTRGLISRSIRLTKLRFKVAQDHLLLEAYEYASNLTPPPHLMHQLPLPFLFNLSLS
jgi:manganese/zinc/iron transport system permease protein